MALEVLIEDDFEHEAEAGQAADLICRLKRMIPADAEYRLLLNFYVDGKQYDALLVTPHRFIIIDFKYVYSPIVKLSPEGHWTCSDGYELEGSGYGNPFKQVTTYRRCLGHFLNGHRREIFSPAHLQGLKSRSLDVMRMISAGICLGPELNKPDPGVSCASFPMWYFMGRPAAFAEKCLMIDHGKPAFLDAKEMRMFLSCFAGLRKAVLNTESIPSRPKPTIIRKPETSVADPASSREGDALTGEDLVSRFQESYRTGQHCFLVMGPAGTGKTTFIKSLLPVLQNLGLNPMLMAPTGRAAKMMQQRTGWAARTIHSSIFKVPDNPELDGDDTYAEFVFPLKQNCPPEAAIIVDEASMVSLSHQNNELFQFGSGSLLEDLLTYSGVRQENCSNIIIFVGDSCQLNPVGEKCKTPPALDPVKLTELLGYAPTVMELSTVHRQGANSGILEEAMRIRSGLVRGKFDLFKYREHPDVTIVDENALRDRYCPEKDLDDKIIIAQKNDDVWDYNTTVRALLHRDAVVLGEGERLMSLRNTRVPIGEDGYEEAFMNGDFLKVVALTPDTPVVVSGFYRVKNSPHPLRFEFTFRKMTVSWAYEMERDPVTIWVNVSPIVSADWRENQDYASIALYNGVRALIRERFPQCSSTEISEKMKVSVLLRAPLVTYGYAITGHKSQGGEWKDVWVDYRYAQNRQTDDYFRWAYTVTTRARQNLFAIAPPCIDNLSDVLNVAVPSVTDVKNGVQARPLVEIVSSFGWKVSNVIPRPYAYRVFLAKTNVPVDVAPIGCYIDLTFNGRNVVTNVSLHLHEVDEAFSNEVKTIVGMSTRSAMADVDAATAGAVPVRKTDVAHELPIHAAHVDTVNRIKSAVEAAGYSLVSVGSMNEFQLRTTIDHPLGNGFFDVYFDGKGRVSKLGQFTLPISVLQQIRKGV